MLKTLDAREAATGYDEDFFRWTQRQAQLLRERRFAELDLANLIEEVESVGRSDKREIRSRLEVLFTHLLKWQFQPTARKAGWTDTIAEQRRRVAYVLKDSPSLRSFPASAFTEAYLSARLEASRETGLESNDFPLAPPFTIKQALDPDFLP